MQLRSRSIVQGSPSELSRSPSQSPANNQKTTTRRKESLLSTAIRDLNDNVLRDNGCGLSSTVEEDVSNEMLSNNWSLFWNIPQVSPIFHRIILINFQIQLSDGTGYLL